MSYVIDASVAGRLLLHEDLSEKAAKLLEDYATGTVDLYAPALITYEVGNTLWKAMTKGYLGVNESRQRLERFLHLGILCVEFEDEDLLRTLEYAAETALTYYDGVYVIAAKKTKTTLLTADDALYSKAGETIPVTHLKDY